MSIATSTPDTPLLVVEGLRTCFPLPGGTEAPAVDDVSFRVDRGEVVSLVGESGSGKSVTALSIVRLVPAPGGITAGRVLLEGEDLLQAGERRMEAIRGRRIGFVFQEPMVALDPVYTIGDQIEETLSVHGLARGSRARARAVELLDAARIPDAARRARDYPHQLSGGLRQRAMIALALAGDPALLIADEPTTALDATVQAEILELLRTLRSELNLAVLLITHDLGVVAEMAERVAVMYAGRIVEEAPVRALFSAPRHPYTQALLRAVPGAVPGSRLHAIPGTVPALGKMPSGCPFGPRCPHRSDACAVVPELRPVGDRHAVRCVLEVAG